MVLIDIHSKWKHTEVIQEGKKIPLMYKVKLYIHVGNNLCKVQKSKENKTESKLISFKPLSVEEP